MNVVRLDDGDPSPPRGRDCRLLAGLVRALNSCGPELRAEVSEWSVERVNKRSIYCATVSLKYPEADGPRRPCLCWGQGASRAAAWKHALADYFSLCGSRAAAGIRVPPSLRAETVEELELKLALAGEGGGGRA